MTIHTVKLKTRKTTTPSWDLDYREVPSGFSQARLQGQLLVPEIALRDFVCTALFDWIEIEAAFGQKTQFQHIQAVLQESYRSDRVTFAKALAPGAGGASNVFRIRFQEPTGSRLSKAIAALREQKGLVDARLNRIELSLDFCPITPSNKARAKLYGALARALAVDDNIMMKDGNRPRYSWWQGPQNTEFLLPTKKGAEDPHFRLRSRGPHWSSVPVNATLYVGRSDGPILWRLMDKVLDQQNNTTARKLADREKRVRLEVSMQAGELTALGITRPEDLRNASFRKFKGKFFKFRLPIFPRKPSSQNGADTMRAVFRRSEIRIFLDAGILGLTATRSARRAHEKMTRAQVRAYLVARGLPAQRHQRSGGPYGTPPFAAWKEVDARIDTALSNLQRSWRR